jgi:hypothetical protein
MAVAVEPTEIPDERARASLSEGTLLAGRYRVLNRTAFGWSAYDERLSRTVLMLPIDGTGAPEERVRREASAGAGLLDAVIVGDDAWAVRIPSRRL